MNEKMQQAIAATRAGQTKQAQLLLAQVLKEDAKNTNAWFLLSHLVDSPGQQAAFLQKVLAIDPHHEKALQRLAELNALEAAPPSAQGIPVTHHSAPNVGEEPLIITSSRLQPATNEESKGLPSQAEGKSVPAWMIDNTEALRAKYAQINEVNELTTASGLEPEDLPDWLTRTTIEKWTAEAPWEQIDNLLDDDEELGPAFVEKAPETVEEPEKVQSVIQAAAASPSPTAKTKRPEPAPRNDKTLNRVLIALVVVAAIVLILLIYVVFSSLAA